MHTNRIGWGTLCVGEYHQKQDIFNQRSHQLTRNQPAAAPITLPKSPSTPTAKTDLRPRSRRRPKWPPWKTSTDVKKRSVNRHPLQRNLPAWNGRKWHSTRARRMTVPHQVQKLATTLRRLVMSLRRRQTGCWGRVNMRLLSRSGLQRATG